MDRLDIAIEAGTRRTFATAVAWPGWSRSARDEEAAIERLLAYAERYRRAIGTARQGFRSPGPGTRIEVIQRVPGDATTDFGAPGQVIAADEQPLDDATLRRDTALLRACWRTFDAVAGRERNTSLTTGPRGGGRTVAAMVAHVLDADRAYLRALGGRASDEAGMDEVRAVFLEAVGARRRGELPDRGPRGGARWLPRHAVRRSAWHALDHAWEIEDRVP